MKNRLYALVMAVMMLFVPLAAFGRDLSTNISPLGDLNVEVSPPFGSPGDTVIRFPDRNFEAAVRAIIHRPYEDDIFASDVAGITSLLLGSRDITDLTGIEYFTALEGLSCDSNELMMLDVSNNAALTWLYCGGNELTELDVSRNAALTELDCGYNELRTLDVSQNPLLIELFCGENYLTRLDVSRNPALELLSCWGNELTTLDVSQNPLLIELSCGENYLTKLDVSQNSALEELECGDNELTELDVSQNPALETLFCAKNLFPDESAIIGLDESRLSFFSFDPQGDF